MARLEQQPKCLWHAAAVPKASLPNAQNPLLAFLCAGLPTALTQQPKLQANSMEVYTDGSGTYVGGQTHLGHSVHFLGQLDLDVCTAT